MTVRTCDYAACSTVAIYDADGWTFCWQHLLEHRADMYGDPWPTLQPVNLSHLFRPRCGTAAAARAHYRRGEKPCQECLDAARRAKAGA